MHTDITPKEMPTRDANPKTSQTDRSSIPNTVHTDKVFYSFDAAFALHGHVLHRTDPKDGMVTYWAERWKMVRYLPTIDAARRLLEQIGGRL